jgi:hypothetical protein
MAITTHTTYILATRPKGSTDIYIGRDGDSPQGYPWADTADELAKNLATRAMNYVYSYASNMVDYAWLKSASDAFWADPATVVEFPAEGAEGPGPLQQMFIAKRVETITDLPGHQAKDVVVTPAF